MLAALLGVDSASETLRTREVEIPLHPGARAVLGEVPGFHSMNQAWVAFGPDDVVVPLGGRPGRLIVQRWFPPVVDDSSLGAYAVALAAMQGDVPPSYRPVNDPAELPVALQTLVSERSIVVKPPVVQPLAGERRQVTVAAYHLALVEIVVMLGRRRSEDSVHSVRLLIGFPPG